MRKPPRSVEFKVGAFVALALLIGIVFAFLIGEQTRFFSRKRSYQAFFRNVEGLREGSLVNIAGVQVGTVHVVSFEADGRVRMKMHIDSESSRFVRRGSVVRIASKGLLGDKVLDISVGRGGKLPDGATLPAEEAASIGTYLETAGRVLHEAEGAARNIRKATDPLAKQQFLDDVQHTVHNAAVLSSNAADPRGTLQHLMTDPRWSQAVDGSLRHTEVSLRELSTSLRDVAAITREVRQGDGTAHDLVYGPTGKRLVRNLADATGEVATMLAQARQGNGMLHELVYEEGGKQMAKNLVQVSADLKWITGEIRAGRGTVGRLLTDPSIYEDVKRLLGNLERNQILKALVRYSIRRDEVRKNSGAIE